MAGKKTATETRAIRYHEFDRHMGGGDGGGGPKDQKPPTLWAALNRKVSDLTVQFRNKACNRLRPAIFALEDEFKRHASGGHKHHRAEDFKNRLDTLNSRFNTIARGGIEGAYVAAKILWLESRRDSQNPTL